MTFIPNPLAGKLAEHEAAPAMKDAAEAAAAGLHLGGKV